MCAASTSDDKGIGENKKKMENKKGGRKKISFSSAFLSSCLAGQSASAALCIHHCYSQGGDCQTPLCCTQAHQPLNVHALMYVSVLVSCMLFFVSEWRTRLPLCLERLLFLQAAELNRQ